MKIKIEKYDVLAVITMFVILLYIVNTGMIGKADDFTYLYNRADQMLSCIKDGNIPFFYYNDFGGVGYGSSFFYGHLNLYPFLPFVSSGVEVFSKVFALVTLLLTYLGSCSLVKRFTSNYKFISLMFLISIFSVSTFSSSSLYACYFGVAISFFFLASCVAFFRDSKSCIPCVVLFFVLFNTHLVTSIISFVGCVTILLVYFDKSRLKEYCLFAITTCLVCSYVILNILFHIGVVTNTDTINQTFYDSAKQGSGVAEFAFAGVYPFTGALDALITDSYLINYSYLSTEVLIICLVVLFLRRRSISKREKVALILSSLGVLISLKPVWFFINEFWLVPIQFPMRFAPYVLLVFLIIALRELQLNRFKIILVGFCLLDLILVGLFTGVEEKRTVSYEESQVMNGEYLDKTFVWDFNVFKDFGSHVYDQDKNSYEYTLESKYTYVTIPQGVDNLVLTLPKLYYKGYEFRNLETGEQYQVKMGYSQFCEVALDGDVSGVYVLVYEHPLFLRLTCLMCYVIIVLLIVYYRFRLY